ncbi:UbiX family flavin prenyltransferase [Marinicrinis lubricantis]|uniref:Flavin prenyltransferase UbiX n=1 Tax=Marinicrinis lubricantis TaxID=2086470 RepID=A0ABW1IM36_9BACL
MTVQNNDQKWVIGITGASGAIYAVTLCKELLKLGMHIHLVITDAGWRVLKDELSWPVHKRADCLEEHLGGLPGTYEYHPIQDIGASIASGSFRTRGMVVVPCSMGTLAGIAHGLSDNLLKRSADVMLKEGRKLILVPRETPLHAIHLENMLKCSKAGAVILPAMPGFYHRPANMDEVIRFLVGKIMDAMNIEHEIYQRWGEHHEHLN